MFTWNPYSVVLVLLAVAVGMGRPHCQPEFAANFLSSIQLTYPIHQGSIDKIWVRVSDNSPLVDLLTTQCRNVNNLRLDYRIVGQKEWMSFTGRRGVIALHKKSAKIRNIDPCAKYEVKVVAIKEHGGGEVESEPLEFGPYYSQLSSEAIKQLGPDSMPDISSSISYSNVNSSGFTVSWGEICAQSLNIFLLTGPEFLYGNIINTLSDIIKTNASRSMWVTAQPCKEYKIAMESFMTTHPLSMENSVDHLARTTVSTTPGFQDLVQATLEEKANFKLFSWNFVDHSNCLADQKYEIYITSQSSEEKKILKKGTSIWKHGEIDLTNHSYRSAICSDIELRMSVNYTTKSGIRDSGLVYKGTLRTNEKGEFGSEGPNYISLGHQTINVTFVSCETEAVLLLVDNLNKEVIKSHKVISDAPEVSLEVFTEHTKPCEKYNIQLVKSKEYTFNEPIGNKDVFDQLEFPAKDPLENVTLELFNATSNSLTFEIIDVEENDKCDVDHYKVKCEEQADTADDDNDDNANDSVAKASKKTVTVTSNESKLITFRNLSSQTDFSCQAQIMYESFEDDSAINSSLILARTGEAPELEQQIVGEVASNVTTDQAKLASANVATTQKMTLVGGVIAVVGFLVLVIIVSAVVFKCRSSRSDSLHVAEQADYKPV